MKIVIVGGGIAGLAVCIRLRKIGYEAVVLERASAFAKIGQGFVLLPNGMNALKTLGVEEQVVNIGTTLEAVRILSPEGRLVTHSDLEDHIGVTRFEFVDILMSEMDPSWIKFACKFEAFEYDNAGNVIAVHCENGHVEKADLVIASDGVRSPIRNILFPNHNPNDVRIKEFVGIINAPDIVDDINHQFQKTRDEDQGLSMGLVPAGGGRLIWYVQYDSKVWDTKSRDPEVLRKFTEELVGNWPYPAKEILDRSDFSTIHHWQTRDMDSLNRFYHKNIVLIGDACHPLLTFTSQGANSALVDAITISDSLVHCIDFKNPITKAFERYQSEREDILKEYLLAGRQLAEKFLYPMKYIGQEQLPLVK